MDIKRADEIHGNIREKISELFVDAFGNDLRFFSNDKNKLIRAFTHMFVPAYFYIALIKNEAVAMAVCVNQKQNTEKKERPVPSYNIYIHNLNIKIIY